MSKHTPLTEERLADPKSVEALIAKLRRVTEGEDGPVYYQAETKGTLEHLEHLYAAARHAERLAEAGEKVMAGLQERIAEADPSSVPVFDGITDLHEALAAYRGEQG